MHGISRSKNVELDLYFGGREYANTKFTCVAVLWIISITDFVIYTHMTVKHLVNMNLHLKIFY